MGAGGRDGDEELLEREYDGADMERFLAPNEYELTASDRARFLPMFVEARSCAQRPVILNAASGRRSPWT